MSSLSSASTRKPAEAGGALSWFLTLMMEAIICSETSGYLRISRRPNPEDHRHGPENLETQPSLTLRPYAYVDVFEFVRNVAETSELSVTHDIAVVGEWPEVRDAASDAEPVPGYFAGRPHPEDPVLRSAQE